MTQPVVIELPGAPVAKGRPKFSTAGGFVKAYTPAKTARYEDALAYVAHQAMRGRALLEGPLRMSVTAGMPIPTSWSKKKQREAAEGYLLPTKRPDWDNFAKIACDGIQNVVFRDDAQVVECMVKKVYSEKPSLRIEVAPYTETLPLLAGATP